MDISSKIEKIIKGPQFRLPQKDKERLLIAMFRSVCRDAMTACLPYQAFVTGCGTEPENWASLSDIPPLPVAMFKRFDLLSTHPENIIRILNSSSTTGNIPSKVYIDKTTAFRQARALVSVLKDFIGSRRRPFLVLDTDDEHAPKGASMPVRSAAVRGVGNFASETVFAMSSTDESNLAPNFEKIATFFETHSNKPVLIYGFTYLIWQNFILKAEQLGLSFVAPKAVLLHSGGWKKMSSQSVSKKEFRKRTSQILGCSKGQILDFYGMAEQLGTVFVDCEHGNKHAPAFADIIVRDPLTFTPLENGQEGIIEVLSLLPSSYPGHVLLTEDQGIVMGCDDCACGRLGRYFRFTNRIEKVEVRGCGDVSPPSPRRHHDSSL